MDAKIDGNYKGTILAVDKDQYSSNQPSTIPVAVNPTTGAVIVEVS